MPYTATSFGQAKADLGRRLFDPVSTFWTDIEKGVYLVEALRTFNAFTSFWRFEFILDTVQGTVWYDIANAAEAPNTLRPMTVTDVDLYRAIQYGLLEPASGAVWTGSAQFNIWDLLGAVQRRRDETLSNTGCTIVRDLVGAAPGRTFLDDRTIDIRRIAWLPVGFGYTNTPMWPDDNFALQSYKNNYRTQDPGEPTSYQQSAQPPLSFDTDIPPAVPGQYEVLSVKAGVALSTVAPTVLNIPDDFSWVVKFGAMGDLLLRDSNAKDFARAAYCNARYRQGNALLFGASSVLSATMNGEALDIDSVQNMDNYRVGWQAEAQGQPDVLLTAGLNMVGFGPTPGAGPYGSAITVVRNAPVPVGDGEFIQLSREDYDAVLDYAVHLASFKMGGQEFLSTIPLFQRFMKQASIYNSKLAELGEYTDVILRMGQLQAEANPVVNDNAVVESTEDV